jgi:hypothetical protein
MVALTMARRQGLGDAKDLPMSHGSSTRPISAAAAAAAAAAKLQGRQEMLLQVSGEIRRGLCALQETGRWSVGAGRYGVEVGRREDGQVYTRYITMS